MSPGEWISLAAFLFEVSVVLCGVIWAVSKLRSAGHALEGSIDHLSDTVTDLKSTLKTHQEYISDHEVRIRMVEHHIPSHPRQQHGGQ